LDFGGQCLFHCLLCRSERKACRSSLHNSILAHTFRMIQRLLGPAEGPDNQQEGGSIFQRGSEVARSCRRARQPRGVKSILAHAFRRVQRLLGHVEAPENQEGEINPCAYFHRGSEVTRSCRRARQSGGKSILVHIFRGGAELLGPVEINPCA